MSDNTRPTLLGGGSLGKQDVKHPGSSAGDSLPTDSSADDYDERVFTNLLKRFRGEEGGIALRSKTDDPGGVTNKGLSEEFLKLYNKKYPSQKLPNDPRDLTDEQMADLLRQEVYRRPQMPALVRIPGLAEAAPALIHQFFDASAQHGDGDAAKWMQQALAKEGFDPRDNPTRPFDGIVGSRTRQALELALKAGKIEAINDRMVDSRIAYAKGLANFAANPGWVPRFERFRMKSSGAGSP